MTRPAKKAEATLSALGGLARRDALSPARRSEIARNAAEERWATASGVPRATHMGTLSIGGSFISCAVLETRRRVLTQETFLKSIGRAGKAKGGKGSTLAMVDGLPPFLAAKNLEPYINDELMAAATPILFRAEKGQRAFGYDANLLPRVCNVYLQARDDRKLLENQEHIAKACDLLMRGLAAVGIIALVDEATGYQYDRARDELNTILEAFIAKELLPWTKRFPDEFFRQIYRLQGWPYQAGKHQRPQYLGKLINKLVYEQLPPGVLPELRRLNPPTEKGYRKHKHHQLLTPEIGNPHLERHLASLTTLMRASQNKMEFEQLFARAFLGAGEQLNLALRD